MVVFTKNQKVTVADSIFWYRFISEATVVQDALDTDERVLVVWGGSNLTHAVPLADVTAI